MTHNNGITFRALRLSALAQLPLGLALMTAACSSTTSGGMASGGASASGGSASGGMSSSGGSGQGGAASGGSVSSGGVSGPGGSAKGGASSSGGVSSSGGAASGGVSSSGGAVSGGASSGSGGGFGGAGTSPKTSAGGSAGSTTVGAGGAAGGSTGAGGGTGVAATPSTGCGKTSTLTFGTVENEDANGIPGGPSLGTGAGGWVTLTSGGQTRNFAMRLPDNYDNTHPYWLIFAFHGNGETADGMDDGGANGYFTAYWGLQRESKNGAIFVAPEWSGGGWGTGDFTFVDDMVKTISTNYCVDMSNIITSGFSYGGGMSHALACSRANPSTNSVGYAFRAAVMFEACSFLVEGTCPNNDPIAIWQKAGLTDGTCGFDDSKTVRDWFTSRDGCTGWTSETGNVAASATGTVSQEPTQPPMPGAYINPGGHVCSNYTGCSSGHSVRWCADQAGHGNATVDGSSSLYDECANTSSTQNPPKGNCTPGCPCTWTPDDVWRWLNDPSSNSYTPNITSGW
ncbi:MAG: hypothetical protein ABSB49_14075 [Polyangia bacterium]|jgi:poly(3-hydroxybutyrate) depolymerase